jgi:hypothetical protein
MCQEWDTLPSSFASFAQYGRLSRFAKRAILLHTKIGPDSSYRGTYRRDGGLGFFSLGAASVQR